MDANRRHATPEPETKDYITHSTTSDPSISTFLSLFPNPQFPPDDTENHVTRADSVVYVKACALSSPVNITTEVFSHVIKSSL